MSIQDEMQKRMIKYLVQRTITCPTTGKILDVRTCAVILDADGDPYAVFDPSVCTDPNGTFGGFSWLKR